MEENYNKYQQERHQEQFQEYQKMNGQKKNSKKGWLWGCGGCLVLVILINYRHFSLYSQYNYH